MNTDKILKNALRTLGYNMYKSRFTIEFRAIDFLEIILKELAQNRLNQSRWNKVYKQFKDKYLVVNRELENEMKIYGQLEDVIYNTKETVTYEHILEIYCMSSPQVKLLIESNENEFHDNLENELDEKSILKKYTVDLKTLSSNILIGRSREIGMLEEIIQRKNKSNAILLGEPGVGKTAIVEGLAKRIKDKTILRVDITGLLAGTRYRGDFEERLLDLLFETEKQRKGKIILFFDEIHMLLSAGGGDGGLDAGNILKPYLARGTISVIGATTSDEYDKKFKCDGALARRFFPIYIKEPNRMETIEILMGIKKVYTDFHKVKVNNILLEYIVDQTNEIVLSKNQPDKAIDILDISLARAKIKGKVTLEKKTIKEVIDDYTNNLL